ncbi:MAG: TVP38/TMEM64 family protein [Sporichthyaceae bacterium]
MPPDSEVPPPVAEQPAGRAGVFRIAGLVFALLLGAALVEFSGWDGPERLQQTVEGAGPAGGVVFVLGYALLVLIPSPASVLTILAGALFGLGGGIALAWAGAMLGAVGGFLLGRVLGRDAVDRLLRGRLTEADRLLRAHGLTAVLAVRLVPLFPFTAINYAAGLLRVRPRDYLAGTAVGILPGATAYAAVGAAGVQPLGIVLGVSVLVLLALGGGWFTRRLLARARSGGEGRVP